VLEGILAGCLEARVGSLLEGRHHVGKAVEIFDRLQSGALGASLGLSDDSGYVSEATRLTLNAAACQRMGVAAGVTALQLDWETIANRFERVIRSAIQSELGPSPDGRVNVPRPIPSR